MSGRREKPRLLDLFAGPGGWDYAAQQLGLDPLGIEWDGAACETRAAAGLRTRQADVAALDPSDFGPVDLCLASPPCQAFSRAGKREGIEDLPHVYEAALALAEGRDPGEVKWKDDRAALVTEPLRWALALEPTYMAWEQVPDVLPFWRYCSGILEAAGWWTWTGVLEAERFGVPQTRERAILLASRAGHVEPPRPTHQRYVKGEPAEEIHTFEGMILPWVSMAEALGWGETGRAYRLARGEGMLERHGDRRAVPEDEPAPVISSKARTAEWVHDRPAPTLTTTRRSDKGMLVGRQLAEGEGRNVGGRNYDRRQKQGPASERVDVPPVPDTEPAPTLTAAGLAKGRDVWTTERPATTLQGDPRIAKPGHKGDKKKEPDAISQMEGAIRVSLSEAAILQSFPPDYPFQGSRTKQFEQVGNAVPPLLAHAVLSSLLADVLSAGASSTTREAA